MLSVGASYVLLLALHYLHTYSILGGAVPSPSPLVSRSVARPLFSAASPVASSSRVAFPRAYAVVPPTEEPKVVVKSEVPVIKQVRSLLQARRGVCSLPRC